MLAVECDIIFVWTVGRNQISRSSRYLLFRRSLVLNARTGPDILIALIESSLSDRRLLTASP